MSIMSIMSTASTTYAGTSPAMVPVQALAVVHCMHIHIIAAHHTSYGWMDALDELVRMVRYELARHETLGASTQSVAWMSSVSMYATSTTIGMLLASTMDTSTGVLW